MDTSRTVQVIDILVLAMSFIVSFLLEIANSRGSHRYPLCAAYSSLYYLVS